MYLTKDVSQSIYSFVLYADANKCVQGQEEISNFLNFLNYVSLKNL